MTIETLPVVVEPRTKTTADVLRHAAWIIEERDWNQGEYESPSGGVCMMGAIYKAEGTDFLGTLSPIASDAVRQLVDHLRNGVATWNDTPGRTAAEVTAALRAAADASERAS